MAAFGFTARQTGFLVAVLRHAGVCLARQYCTYAGIVRGQKTHDFFGRLVARRYATPYRCGHGNARVYHVHHKALYRAIGEPDARFRRPAAIARAIERLIVLDYVLAHRDLTWLATEREKVEHFVETTGLRHAELPSVTFGRGGVTTTRYFLEKLPIGVAPDGHHVFVYLAARDAPVDFRAFLHRHAELLYALPEWRLRVLVPRHLTASIPAYEQAFREALLQPVRPDVADDPVWYFRERRTGDGRQTERLQPARRDFSAPRFRSLYRAWQEGGDRVVYAAMSSVLLDAIHRGQVGWTARWRPINTFTLLVWSARPDVEERGTDAGTRAKGRCSPLGERGWGS
jgi:hypothetical protein